MNEKMFTEAEKEFIVVILVAIILMRIVSMASFILSGISFFDTFIVSAVLCVIYSGNSGGKIQFSRNRRAR
jgi:hypothetical protein